MGDKPRPGDLWRKLGSEGSIGFTLVGCTFAGLAGGYFLDRRLETAPLLTIGGLLLGIVAGFVNLFYRGRGGRDQGL